MKKFFTVILCTFIILFNDINVVNTNIFAETKTINKNVLVEYEAIVKNVEQETLEKQEIVNSTASETVTTDKYVEEDFSHNESYSENYGTYGRLYVSWDDVALYDYNVYTESSSSLQELVDNYDSAAYYANKGRLVIADHNTQGFSVLYSLSEGSTSYIKFADGSTISYRLIKKEKGYNIGPDLVDTAGNSFYDMDSSLIMYTCYDDGIMVTLWVIA